MKNYESEEYKKKTCRLRNFFGLKIFNLINELTSIERKGFFNIKNTFCRLIEKYILRNWEKVCTRDKKNRKVACL